MRDFSQPEPKSSRVQSSFRRGLSSYHHHAVVQAKIAEKLATEMLAAGVARDVPRLLEFGCGTGHFTRNLRSQFAIKELFINDLVDECNVNSRAYSGHFIGGDINKICLPQPLDVICAASTVQWVKDLPGLMHRLTQHLRPGGFLALSSFGPTHFKELQQLGSQAAAPSYINAANWPAILPEDLQVKYLEETEISLSFDRALDVLHHLRKTGVNGQSSNLWTKSNLRCFSERYHSNFAQNSKLPLTYAPVWLVAQKRR